jgi:ABC-type hemin transport system ATPase subunit
VTVGEAQPLLEVHGLIKHFGGVAAVNGVSLRVFAGQVVSVIGPNGSGKTTTFNLIGGQLRPEAGEVVFDGTPITGLEPDRVGLDTNDVALSFLSFASGSTDVLSFVGLTGVLTSAMTGNTAILGLALGQAQLPTASRTFDALAAFLCGVAAGTLLQRQGVHPRASSGTSGRGAVPGSICDNRYQ